MNIIDKLNDLHKQATVERSHHYVGAVIKEAIAEIERLKRELRDEMAERREQQRSGGNYWGDMIGEDRD